MRNLINRALVVILIAVHSVSGWAGNVVVEATGAKIVAGQAGVAATAPVDANGPFGYLAESAATQIIATTADIRDMTTANWTLGATLTRARTSVGADGAANSATRLTAGAVAATNTITYLVTAAASSRTYSALVRRVTGTGPVLITQGATTSDISSLLNTSTYTRVALNASVLNATIGFQLNTNLDAIDVDFNQFEAGTIATSRIATGGATRPADVLTYPLTGNVSGIQGSSYAEITTNIPAGSALQGTILGSTSGDLMYMRGTTQALSLYDGAQRSGNAITPSATTIIKVASSWGGSSSQTFINGVASSNLGFDGDIGLATNLQIGAENSLAQLNGTIRNVRIYPRALPAAKLQALKTAMVDLRDSRYMYAANDERWRLAANR